MTERRQLPSIGRLLENERIQDALGMLPRPLILDALRRTVDLARVSVTEGGPVPDIDALVTSALAVANGAAGNTLRQAINATGIVLHTGLGRAVLPEQAVRAVVEAVSGHATLEVDEETGRRGSRRAHVEGLLRTLTGAEAAFAVNNNAGAVFLAVTALAQGREVIISRGELVEIGGSFRMPDIIAAGGGRLREVGTTNRTRLRDYREAVTDNTGLILRCHPSNFRVIGFTEEADTSELVQLGTEFGIPVMDDLGSGALVNTAQFGAGSCATLPEAVAKGCGVVTASGDKLLGGPQSGLILGKREFVDKIAAHPLARALRLDKMTLVALETVLRLYQDPTNAMQAVPVLRYLARSRDELRRMALKLSERITSGARDLVFVDLVDGESQVGGGSLPGENLPTVCVRIKMRNLSITLDEMARRLRQHRPALFGRIRDDALLLDPRTMEDCEIEAAADCVLRAVGSLDDEAD